MELFQYIGIIPMLKLEDFYIDREC